MEIKADNIERAIIDIAEELVVCERKCPGVRCEPENGILPRCLIFEGERYGRFGDTGSIVIGIYPGRGRQNDPERQHYIKYGPSYESLFQWWDAYAISHPYHQRLRDLVSALGFHGPIVWTEHVKCERQNKSPSLPEVTWQTCRDAFLRREIDALTTDWPIIIVGSSNYERLEKLFWIAERKTIGVPDPVYHIREWHEIFSREDDTRLTHECITGVCEYLGHGNTPVWLPELAARGPVGKPRDSSDEIPPKPRIPKPFEIEILGMVSNEKMIIRHLDRIFNDLGFAFKDWKVTFRTPNELKGSFDVSRYKQPCSAATVVILGQLWEHHWLTKNKNELKPPKYIPFEEGDVRKPLTADEAARIVRNHIRNYYTV